MSSVRISLDEIRLLIRTENPILRNEISSDVMHELKGLLDAKLAERAARLMQVTFGSTEAYGAPGTPEGDRVKR